MVKTTTCYKIPHTRCYVTQPVKCIRVPCPKPESIKLDGGDKYSVARVETGIFGPGYTVCKIPPPGTSGLPVCQHYKNLTFTKNGFLIGNLPPSYF